MEIGKIVLDLVVGLITKSIEGIIEKAGVTFFTRRRIIRRIEDATAEVIEPMLPFLSVEGVSEQKQALLIEVIVAELRPIAEDSAVLFRASLDGQKIFDQLYADKPLPATITEAGLRDIYALIFPRIATLLCKIPAAVEDWESQAWSENFRRFDEIASQLRALFGKVDSLTTAETRESDEVLWIIRRALAQKIGLELDLTGLRADTPLAGKFDDFFVLPELSRETKTAENKREKVHEIGDILERFVSPESLSVVFGAPGAGKSTWTKWLQRKGLTKESSALPVRVELRNLAVEALPTLHDLIRSVVAKHLVDDLTSHRLTQWLRERKVWFILDGFDEIRPSDRDAVMEWVIGVADAGRGCPVVLTSRPLTTDQLSRMPAAWAVWNIEPFDTARVVDYVARWYEHTPLIVGDRPDVDPAALAASWSRDPTLAPLTGNPLLLSTLLTVHHLDGRLPAGRAQLYRRYVDGMLGLWDDRRRVVAAPVELTIEQKRQILRSLAILFFERQIDQLDEHDLADWLRARLDLLRIRLTPDVVMSVLRERTGLLVGPGVYSFAHKTISEFLIADAVVQGDQVDSSGARFDRFRLFESRDDDRWNTVTFLWAGLAPITDVIAFIDECVDAGTLDLAGGILDDQYERIVAGERRRLLELLWSRAELSREISDYIIPQPVGGKRNIPVPTMEIRSLTASGGHLYHIILRACADETIDWSLISNSNDGVRDMFVMAILATMSDINLWRKCLFEPPPKGISVDLWADWIIQRACFAAWSGRQKDVTAFIAAYREVHPEQLHRVKLAVIASFCDAFGFGAWQRWQATAVRWSIPGLAGDDFPEPTTSDLCSTRHWIFFGLKDVDLLQEAVKCLSQPTIDKEIARAMEAYFCSLIARREKECPADVDSG